MKIIKEIAVNLGNYTQHLGLTKNGRLHRRMDANGNYEEDGYITLSDLKKIGSALPKVTEIRRKLTKVTEERESVLKLRESKVAKIRSLREEAAKLERELNQPDSALIKVNDECMDGEHKLLKLTLNRGSDDQYTIRFHRDTLNIGCNRFDYKLVPLFLKRIRDAIKKSPLLK